MKKKAIFRSLAAVTLLAALVLSFTACSSDEKKHRVYILTKLLAVCQEQEATLLLRLQL